MISRKQVSHRTKRIARIAAGVPFAVLFLFIMIPFGVVIRLIYIGAVLIDASRAAFNKRTFAIVRARNFFRSLNWWIWANVIWLATARGEPLPKPRVTSHEDR